VVYDVTTSILKNMIGGGWITFFGSSLYFAGVALVNEIGQGHWFR